MTGTFERTRRIVKTDEFSSVFRLKPVSRTPHLVLYATPNKLPFARLGVVVAKRLAPRAVTRNAVKRAVREGFRQHAMLREAGVDCVVRLTHAIGSKSGPACNVDMQAVLLAEVTALFASSPRLNQLAGMPQGSNADLGVTT